MWAGGGNSLWGTKIVLIYLKVDVAVLQPVDASLVEEVNIFDEQTEERDDNLQDNPRRKRFGVKVDFHMTLACDLKKHRIKGRITTKSSSWRSFPRENLILLRSIEIHVHTSVSSNSTLRT